jgi:hypothetical protein
MSVKTSLTWTLQPAPHELTSAEVKALYGSLIREGLAAFRSDPNYLADVMESWARDRDHTEAMSARREKAQQRDEEARQRLADRLAKSRAKQAPVKQHRRPEPTKRRGPYKPNPAILERDSAVLKMRTEGRPKAVVLEVLNISHDEYGHSVRRLQRAGTPVPRDRAAEQRGIKKPR